MRPSKQLSLPPMEVEKVHRSTPNRLREWVGAWRELFRRHAPQKCIAQTLGVSERLLSEQLQYDGEEHAKHLSLWRLHEMPPEFWQDAIGVLMEFYDLAHERRDPNRDALAQAVRDLLKAHGR